MQLLIYRRIRYPSTCSSTHAIGTEGVVLLMLEAGMFQYNTKIRASALI